MEVTLCNITLYICTPLNILRQNQTDMKLIHNQVDGNLVQGDCQMTAGIPWKM